VTPRQLARIHVVLRTRQKLRQQDVASAAGISRHVVQKLEAGHVDGLRMDQIRQSFSALGAGVNLTAYRRGADLARILDEVHALLAGAVVEILLSAGWEVNVEVSYSIGREIGSIDILAWRQAERALLVVEIKSELPGVDPLLRPLDAKVRLATRIARERFGWNAVTVSRLVVLPEDRTARRLVDRHAGVIRTALPARSRDVRRWLKRPSIALAGLWFLTIAQPGSAMRNRTAIRRVRRPSSRLIASSVGAEEVSLGRFDPHKVGPRGI